MSARTKLVHKESIKGFILSALLSTKLSDDLNIIKGRISVLQELDAAFGLEMDRDIYADKLALIEGN